METNFISQSFKATLATLTGNSDNYLDIMGRCQQLESVVQGLESDYRMLETNLNKAFYRQNRENKTIINTLNTLTLEKMWLSYPGFQKGLLETIPVLSKRKQRLDWEDINVYPMNSDFQVLNRQINTEFIKPITLVSSAGSDAPYCMVHAKLPPYITAHSLVVGKNYTDVVSVQIYRNGQWQELPIDILLTMKESKLYIDEMFNEIKIVFKNKKINNEYFFTTDLECFEIAKKSIIQAAKIRLNPLANSLFLSGFENVFYFDGYLSVNKKRYQIQIPMKELSLSRLVKTNYSAMSGFTVFRCPFPVETEDTVQVYKSLNTGESLSQWQWKIQGEEDWRNPSELEDYSYPGIERFSNTPRYFYVKIQGYADSIFLSYRTKNNINCSWPLSDDEVLQYNGIGVLLNNPNTSNLVLTGAFYGLGTVDLGQGSLLGMLGVD